jgi:hypothetical protein
MAAGHPAAILLKNRNREWHAFNPEVIGDGRQYRNEVDADERCEVRLNVGIPWQVLGDRFLFLQQTRIGCHINTDSIVSVFQGQIAEALGLRPQPPFIDGFSTCMELIPGYWNLHEVHVGLGPNFIPVNIWFPVEYGNHGWQWRRLFPIWNTLGMRGVIDKRMLCINELEVYAFEWLSPNNYPREKPK